MATQTPPVAEVEAQTQSQETHSPVVSDEEHRNDETKTPQREVQPEKPPRQSRLPKPQPPKPPAGPKRGITKGDSSAQVTPSQNDPAFDYLVDAGSEDQEGLFPAGEVSLIAGASGSGRTTLLLQLILSLHRKEPFFGHKTHVKPYVFLLYDRSENGLKRTARRMHIDLKELNPYRPTDVEAGLTLINLLRKLLNTPRFKDTKVFFIEGLDMLVPQGKTGDLTTVTKFLDMLQRLAQKHGLTIIGSVGSPKMKPNEKYLSPRDLIFGSVGWGRKAETIIYVEQKNAKDPDSLRDFWILTRNGKEERRAVRWENGQLIETDDHGRVTVEQRVIEWMEKKVKPGQEFQLKQVVSALACSDSTAASALDKLVESGRAEKPRHGFYRRSSMNVFTP